MSQATDHNITTESKRPQITMEDWAFDLEEPLFRLRNLAYAVRMLASSDEMQKLPGAALDCLASTLIDELEVLREEYTRLAGAA